MRTANGHCPSDLASWRRIEAQVSRRRKVAEDALMDRYASRQARAVWADIGMHIAGVIGGCIGAAIVIGAVALASHYLGGGL